MTLTFVLKTPTWLRSFSSLSEVVLFPPLLSFARGAELIYVFPVCLDRDPE